MAGQGTVGLELAGELDDLDAVVVPVGGGGLIAGVATAVKALHPGRGSSASSPRRATTSRARCAPASASRSRCPRRSPTASR